MVHDLNADPALPFADDSFDAAVCCVSVDYLVHPIEVFAERRPGACARAGRSSARSRTGASRPRRSGAGCTASDAEHGEIVAEYFRRAGGLDEPVVERRTPAGHLGDPLWAVWAHRR